jgi:hypothetical protein
MVYDEAYNTDDISLWKAHLAELCENGTPLIVDYAMATPVEVDISEHLKDTNYIQVKGNGTITAKNANNADVPSTITYAMYKGD